VLAKTVRHFLPGFPAALAGLPDARDPDRIVYPKQLLVWSGVLIPLLGLGARRQFRFEADTQAFAANLNALAHTHCETAPHDDTIVYYLEGVPPGSFEGLPVHVARRLIRMKVLDRSRLYGRFLVVFDATGHLFFRRRHCPHCLTQKASDGSTLYYHHVLEAKLVTANGFAFSLGSEFIENDDPEASKQDCELKAFARLAPKLKARFPRLGIVALLDGLYACGPVFDECRRHGWRFIVTFKEGSLPSLFAEFQTLRDLAPRQRAERRNGSVVQHFAWVNDLDYHGHRLTAFECREERPDGSHYFAWLTNTPLGCKSVVTYANQGGRLRWKIENEGFRTQKHGGYELEHAYSTDDDVAKIFYYLIQVAHALNQLVTRGSLLRDFRRLLGSLRNYRRRLAEALRHTLIPAEAWDAGAARAIQIRFDTS